MAKPKTGGAAPAAPAADAATVAFEVRARLRFDGKLYVPGDILEIPDDDAAADLVGMAVLRRLVDPAASSAGKPDE